MKLFEIDPELLKKTVPVAHKNEEKTSIKKKPATKRKAEISEPVESEDLTPEIESKHKKAKKPKKEVEISATPEPESPTPQVSEKPKSEKQLAAIEKRKETLRLKKEAVEAKEKEAMEKERLKEEKKAAANEKRRLRRLEKKTTSPAESPKDEGTTSTMGVKEEKVAKTPKNPDDPPVWFKQYVKQAKKIEPSKQEVHEKAEKTWADEISRDKLNNEVKAHNHKMYSMIFRDRVLV